VTKINYLISIALNNVLFGTMNHPSILIKYSQYLKTKKATSKQLFTYLFVILQIFTTFTNI